MTIRTFEDPRKSDLRERVVLAVEAAGLEIVDVVKIDVPASAGLKGGILGDIRAIDGDGVRHCFFVRVAGDRSVPQWIASYAHAAHSLDRVQVHVVVEQTSTAIEKSCRACGAGLLQLLSDGDYRLNRLIDPSEYDPARRRADLEARARDLRRRLQTKFDANVNPMKETLAQLSELTRGFTPTQQDDYEERIETSISRLGEWAFQVGQILDEAVASNDLNLLAFAERRITEEGNVEGR